MRHATLLLACAAVLFCAACDGDGITSADQPGATSVDRPEQAPSLSAAGKSGCYAVKGAISETGVFPSFAGTVTGDLIGTSETTLSFDLRFTGAVIHNPGERMLTITGGTVPELMGETLHETFDGLSAFRAGPLIRINERTRIDQGAERGNLTAHGYLDQRPFPWEVELTYHGVICP